MRTVLEILTNPNVSLRARQEDVFFSSFLYFIIIVDD